MSVIAFGSARSSPGVTTTVLALAARWPTDREPLVVEADPSGGDLVARLTSLDGQADGLRATPSTVQLAASGRSGLSDRGFLEHLQRLPGPGEVRVLVGPASSFAASTAMAGLVGAGIGDLLAGLSGLDVLVDVGRVDASSPAVPLLGRFGSVVLVARPTLASVLHTRELVASLRGLGVGCSLIVIGDRPYSPADVVDAIGPVGLLGVLPDDPVGARALSGDARNAKVLGRTRLVRAATELAVRLAPTATPSAAPGAGSVSPGSSEVVDLSVSPVQVGL
jgi:hypothetical protein